MQRAFLILFSVSLLLGSSWSYSQSTGENDRLREKIRESGQADVTVPFVSHKEADFLSAKLSVYSYRNKQLYVSLSSADVEWFLSQGIEYQIIETKGEKGLLTAADVKEAMEWDTYPTYTQYDSILRRFTALYPSLCRLDTIGSTIYNKQVLALKISDNVRDDENEPKVFYTSSMHGDETGGYVLMLRLIDYLLKNYDTDPEAKNLVDNLEIWINPLANPDGTYRTGNTIASPVRWNAEGKDLNRSFPDPMDPSIVIAKENKDMIQFMRKHHFNLSVNFHAGAEVVNYPWDRWYSKYHADDSWFLSVSRAYADTVHKFSGTGYMTDESDGVTRGADWYVVYGGRQDYVTWELQGREVTIELDAIKITPVAQLSLLWLYNRNSFLGYMENALYGIHGTVRDSAALKPVKAMVYIAGHDKDSSQVYSDTLYGAFTRMLAPGSYNLTFSAPGYKDRTVNDVTVFAGQKTDLMVDMQPENTKIPVSDPPLLYPNPSAGTIFYILPKGNTGDLNIRIYNSSGKICRDFNKFYQEGSFNTIYVADLAAGSYIITFTNITSGSISKAKFILVK